MLRSALVLAALLLAFPAKAQHAVPIEALVDAYHEADRFNGAVLVSDGGETVWSGGVGLANVEWDVPNAADTRFRVGSVTKQFTAAIVLQLMEEGLVDLDAPLTTYLPDYPAEPGDRVTIHHLLVHTSGIPSYTGLPDFGETMRDPYAPDSFLTVFQDLPLEFEPGSEWRYNNSGYFLLGVVIEKVTGQTYAEALEERILEPLGMDDSVYDDYAEVSPRAASGYERTSGGFEHAPYLDTSQPYAAGMLLSTVGDLKTWSDALFGGQVFDSPETLALMNTPHEAIPGGSAHYGYGVFIRTASVAGQEVPIIEHGGGINGFTTSFYRLTDRDAVIVAVSNTQDGSGALVQGLGQILHGETPDVPKPSAIGSIREALATGGIEAAEAAFEAARAGDAYEVDEFTLNTLGYETLGDGDAETAVAIFRLNVAAYPERPNPYDSLGEALLEAGDREAAIASYQQALEIDPTFGSARAALTRLGVEVEEPAGVAVPEAVLETYVGEYQIQPGFSLEVTRDGSRLFVQATGQSQAEILARSETEFVVSVVDARIVFETGDPSPALTLFQGGAQIRAPRVEG